MTRQMLNIPFVSRYGVGGARRDCGACCVAMLLEAMAQPASPEEIASAAEAGRAAGQSGCRLSPTALIRGAAAGGLTIFRTKGHTLDDLKHLIDDGQPPIVRLKYGAIPDRPERRLTGVHEVLVVGYDEELGLLFVNDPHYPQAGTEGDGGYRRPYAYQIFLDAWAACDFSMFAPVPVTTSAPSPEVAAAGPSLEAAISFSLAASAGLGDVWVVAPLGLMVRPQPDVASRSASGVPFGQRLTALSSETARDAKGYTWRQIRSDDYGLSGWVAASADGNRYLADTPPFEPYTVYVLDTAPVRQAGGLSVRERRDIEAPLCERIPIGGQLTVYQRVMEADGTPWLWVKSSAGTFGWVREWAENVMLVGYSTPVGPTPAPISGFLIDQPEVRQLPLIPATLCTVPAGASLEVQMVARIWNNYGGLIGPLAEKLGFDPAVAVATVAAESGGRAFGPDGRMIIRLENHIFWSNWGKYHPDVFNMYFQLDNAQYGHAYRPAPDVAWRKFHGDHLEEWNAFNLAQQLDARAAKLSISMGLMQIMGFNYSMIGYASVEAMFEAFQSEERIQLIGFFDFVKSRGAVPALQSKDFVRFARLYNGAGQENIYAPRIKLYHDAFHCL